MDARAKVWLAGSVLGAAIFAAILYRTITSAIPSEIPSGLVDTAERADVQREVAAHLARYDAVVTQFLVAVHERRFADAHASMAAGYREMVPLERFESAVARNPWFTGFEDVEITGTRARGGSVDAEGTLRFDGGTIRIVAHFVEEGAAPKLMGISLGGTSALPGLAD